MPGSTSSRVKFYSLTCGHHTYIYIYILRKCRLYTYIYILHGYKEGVSPCCSVFGWFHERKCAGQLGWMWQTHGRYMKIPITKGLTSKTRSHLGPPCDPAVGIGPPPFAMHGALARSAANDPARGDHQLCREPPTLCPAQGESQACLGAGR